MSNDLLSRLRDEAQKLKPSKEHLGTEGIRGVFRDKIESHKKTGFKVFTFFIVFLVPTVLLIFVTGCFSYLLKGYWFSPSVNFYDFTSALFGIAVMIFLGVTLLIVLNSSITGQLFEKIICQHCLRTVFISEIQFECPFCRQFYGIKQNEQGKDYETADRKKALLYECQKCQGIIQYISCPHVECGKPIDLFAPYDEKKLEMRRYD